MNFLDLFTYREMYVQNKVAVYLGVKLLKDIDWDHGDDIEAILYLDTGRLYLQEWLDSQQICNQKNVPIEVVS